jgi:hypothetical protein
MIWSTFLLYSITSICLLTYFKRGKCVNWVCVTCRILGMLGDPRRWRQFLGVRQISLGPEPVASLPPAASGTDGWWTGTGKGIRQWEILISCYRINLWTKYTNISMGYEYVTTKVSHSRFYVENWNANKCRSIRTLQLSIQNFLQLYL